jgi:Tol biopolymer transport system component/DNA-binding winged helix-turn-helix (wHTH) protein
LRFGSFELSLASGELRKNGVRLRLSGQSIQVLVILTEHPGSIVLREELQQRLWPGNSYGDFEHGLNAAVNRLRETLGDSADSPKYIETIPRRGYRFVGTIKPGPPDSERNGKPKYAFLLKHWKRLAFAGLAFAAIAVLLSLWLRRGKQTEALRVVPLSTLPGEKISPTFSPDGSQVAFGWDGGTQGAGFDVYVKVIGTETPLRLTSHPAKWLYAAWSPDGRSIALARFGTQEAGIYLIPALGGPERKLAPLVMATFFLASGLSWSADGKQIVFVDLGDQSSGPNRLQLYQLSLDSPQRRVIDTGCAQALAPAFSPGGDLLAYVCEETWGISAINLRHTSNGSTGLVYRAQGDIDALAWSRDGKRLAFSTNDPDGPGLYQIAIAIPGHREKVWVGHDATKVGTSSSGNKLAFVQRWWNANIWEVDLRGHEPRARKLITSTRRQSMPAISPDGSKIAFYSDRSGSDEIWICDGDGSNSVQVTSFGGAQTGTPRWSPDGKRLAFDSRAAGEANVYTVDLGGIPRKLETGTHDNSEPSWSHDGRWLYFTADATTWKVSAQGGNALRITRPNALVPQESTDGLYVYFLRRIDDKFYVWRVRPGGSDEQPVAGLPPVDYEGWYPTQSGIYFIQNSGMGIQYFDLATSHIRRIYALQKDPLPVIGGLAISPDGTWLLYSQIDEISSDLMLVENWR